MKEARQEGQGLQARLGKKFESTPPSLKQKKRRLGSTHLLSQLWWEAYNKRIKTQADLGKKGDPVSKTTRAKRAGGVAQVGEHLRSKQKP
jgi:hypothetical protein